jgi:hypothetical protein
MGKYGKIWENMGNSTNRCCGGGILYKKLATRIHISVDKNGGFYGWINVGYLLDMKFMRYWFNIYLWIST